MHRNHTRTRCVMCDFLTQNKSDMILEFLIFSAIFLLFAYFVFRKAIRRDYKSHMKLSPISYMLEIIIFGIHANSIYLILPTQWPNIPQLPDSQFVRIVSAIIFAIGVVILFVAWFGLGTKSSLGMDKNRLNTSGLYKFSRNPQLVGYGIMLVSFTILFFSWLTIIWILLYLIASYFMVKSEEEFLEQKYGQEYKEYSNSVPRIL